MSCKTNERLGTARLGSALSAGLETSRDARGLVARLEVENV